MLKPFPSLLGKAPFTQENFSQDRTEWGSRGEGDLLAIAKAEGARVKDGNSWFWDAKKPRARHISRACTGPEPDGVSDLKIPATWDFGPFLSRDCRQKDHWLPLKVNAGRKLLSTVRTQRKMPCNPVSVLLQYLFRSDYKRNIYSLHKIR